MKLYPGKEIRKWYLDKLTGIELDGLTIPVYNLARIKSKPPYILLVNQTASSSDTKTTYNDNVSILVQCVTAFAGDFGGDEFADRMADEVTKRITADRPNYGNTDNFKIVTCQIASNDTLRQQNPSETYITRQIDFQHFVSQITNLS